VLRDNEVFQQDGVSAQRAKATVKWIQDQFHLIENWPVNSLDLSVIENLWAVMKRNVSTRSPKTTPELKEILMEEWDKLDQQMIDSLIRSTSERFRLCVENEDTAIGDVLSCTRTDAIRRAELRPKLPKGMAIPKLLNITNVSTMFRCYGIVTRIGLVVGQETENFLMKMQNPPQFISERQIPGEGIIRVFGRD
jgi:hypothetical protein